MNIVKNFNTINFRLNQIDALEAVIHVMTYLIKYGSKKNQKTEDLNLSVFKIITGISESKTLTKYISCECKCKFDGGSCNSNQWWNDDKYQCECKKRHLWNPAKCNCKNGKYLATTTDNSVITCDQIIEETVSQFKPSCSHWNL